MDKLGDPEPFGLEYIGIGNEEVREPFFERYPYFHRAIKEKYPDIKVINSAGPFAAGGEYERGWNPQEKIIGSCGRALLSVAGMVSGPLPPLRPFQSR